ncbi:hypothetical protein [Ruegeria atlantica]|nr:hypothetical protein [Ruegeria atlantica]
MFQSPQGQVYHAFGDVVVVTVSASAHAGFQMVLTQERLPFTADELGALN